tara:strand:+ start:31461 stop:32102 length:642 start_codon:yes stop_codon:yes gene_type:complete
MILFERPFQDYFGLLIPILFAGFLITYVKQNKPGLISSFVIAPFNKIQFKAIQKNFDENTNIILFWCTLFLQSIYVNTLFLDSENSIYLIYIIFFSLTLTKHCVLKLSDVIFQKDAVFKDYYTSFFINVVNLGLFSIPLSVINIIYFNQLSSNQFQGLNLLFIIIVLVYLFVRTITMVVAGIKEKVSYLHIIVYLCTLEILPIVIISSFFSNY